MAAALLLLLSAMPARAKELVLVADPWCPYNCDPATGREGYMVDVARAVFEPLGYTIIYRLESWTAAKRMVEQGHAHGIIGSTGADEVYAVYPRRALGMYANAIASRIADRFVFAGLESLEPYRLAVIKGYEYGEFLDPYLIANATNPDRVLVQGGFGYNQLSQTLRLLLTGHVDLVVDDRNVLSWTIGRLRIGGLLTQVTVDRPRPVSIGFSAHLPNAQALADQLDSGIDRLRRDGRLAEILAGYGLEDWER